MVLFPVAGFSGAGPGPAHLANGVDYSWPTGLVVSGLVYWVLSRSLGLTAERAAIEASDHELEALER
jgi:nucleobase:cation symporter-1, NCS1 family